MVGKPPAGSGGIRHDRRRSKRVIQQAFVRPAWLDPPVSREREIAEARITAIDRERLGKFAGEVGGSDVQRPACHSKHHPLPPQRRQPPAKCLHLNYQRWLGLSSGPADAPYQQGTKACRRQPYEISPCFHREPLVGGHFIPVRSRCEARPDSGRKPVRPRPVGVEQTRTSLATARPQDDVLLRRFLLPAVAPDHPPSVALHPVSAFWMLSPRGAFAQKSGGAAASARAHFRHMSSGTFQICQYVV